MIEKIGRIKSTLFGVEDHGIMTFWLEFDFGSSGQSFGGYCLDTYSEKEKDRIGTAGGMDAIIQILKVCGVEKWEDIEGKIMYALYDNDEYNELIKGIKGLPFESNKAFLLSEWQQRWFPKEVK